MNRSLFRFECARCERHEVIEFDTLVTPNQALATLGWAHVGDDVYCPVHQKDADDGNPDRLPRSQSPSLTRSP